MLWESVNTSAYPGNPPFVTHVRREGDSSSACPHSASSSAAADDSDGEGASWGARITRHLYGKPTPDGRLIFGGDRRTHPPQSAGRVHPLPRILRDAHAVCHDHATSLLREARDVPVEQAWGGIMPFSIDGVPIVGRVRHPPPVASGQRNATGTREHEMTPPLYVVSGLGPSGFMKGPMAGVALAAMMAEDGAVGSDRTRAVADHQLLVRVARDVLACAAPARFA